MKVNATIFDLFRPYQQLENFEKLNIKVSGKFGSFKVLIVLIAGLKKSSSKENTFFHKLISENPCSHPC